MPQLGLVSLLHAAPALPQSHFWLTQIGLEPPLHEGAASLSQVFSGSPHRPNSNEPEEIQVTPVTLPTSLTTAKERKITMSPIRAQVIVFRPSSTFSFSPPEVKNLNP